MMSITYCEVYSGNIDNSENASISSDVTRRMCEVYSSLRNDGPVSSIFYESRWSSGLRAYVIVGYLYARIFPKEEWRDKACEVFDHYENL